MKELITVLRLQGFPFVWGLFIALACGFGLWSGAPALLYELMLWFGLVAGLVVAARAWVKAVGGR